MIRSITALAGTLALTALTAAAPALAQNPASSPTLAPLPMQTLAPAAASDPATVVARVGRDEITAGDVAEAYDELPKQYRQVPMNTLYPQLVDQLVNRKLMLQAGLAAKLDTDPAVKAEVAKFEQYAVQRAYLERFVDNSVTEAALRKEYDTKVASQKGAEQVKASHILLQSEDDAKAVIKELAGGADFAAVARARSTGPSAPNGGDLGYFSKDQMVAEFAEAAFGMADGEVSKAPVKTQFGWHVIKVTGHRTQPPPSFEEVRDDLHEQLTRTALAAHMAEMRKTTRVEKFNPDGSPMAAPGGNKGDAK